MTSHTLSNDSYATNGLLLHDSPTTIILGLPGTDYQLHLLVDAAIGADLGKPITGRIDARAKRVDVVRTGGRFIEPVYGRPRGLQGRIAAIDPAANAITIHCGCPFVCQLVASQKATAFSQGILVRFDIERGATFKPLPAT